MRVISRLLTAIILLLIAADLSLCFAIQNTPEQAATSDELNKLRAEFQTASDLDETTKGQIETKLNGAEQAIARTAELDKLVNDFNELPDIIEQRKTLEQQIEALKQLDAINPEIPGDIDALTSQINSTKDKVEQLKKLMVESDAESNRRTTRREEIRTRQLVIESEFPQVSTQLSSFPESDASILTRTRRLRLRTQKSNLERESALLKTELSRFDAEEKEGIPRLQRELYRGQLAQQQNYLSRLEEAGNQREKKAAVEASSEAKRLQASMKDRNPLLIKSYKVNTELAEQNEQFVERSADVKTELGDLKKRLEGLQRHFVETEAMVNQVGLSGSVGNLLRQRKSELPNPQISLNKAKITKIEFENVQFQLFDINRRQTELTRESIESEILTANESATPASFANLDAQIETILVSRREILEASRRNVRSLFESLFDMEYRYRTLANVSQEYRAYLNERIFWIKSNKLLFSELSIDESDLRLVQSNSWNNVGNSFGKLFSSSPLLFGFLFFGLAGLIVLRPRLRSEIRSMGQTAARGACDTFWPSLRTLFATCLLAIVVPLPLCCVGMAIQQSHLNDGRSLFAALGSAFITAGLFSLPIEFLRHVCRDGGLAQKHFAWSKDAVSILKQNLGWSSPVGTGIVFVVSLLQRLDLSHRVDLIERLFFVAGMLCLFIFLRRCLSPKHGIFHAYLEANPRSWANQTASLWYYTILSIPVLLGILAVWGYYYTTTSLVICAFSTVVFVIIVETLRALLMRFILVRRRHVHIETAKRKREVERELRKQNLLHHQASPSDNSSQILPDPLPETDPEVDIDENAVEASKLVGLGMWIVLAAGLWIIWADVLPALKALDKKPIFSSQLLESQPVIAPSITNTAKSNGDKPVAEGESQPSPLNPTGVEVAQPTTGKELSAVTYGDLLLFLVISIITIAAARSLPSTLEMIFLNQLPFDRSIRYATKSLISYAIVLVGMILAFRALSISWSNVQWLATALTFGLAFGLQEIFANFVAGIILMFERPMRIGDWITIDEFTGMVTKIRTRATTIINLERKEFVIPNKDFITGRLVNWTLSDAINRIEVKVGIAYGSDVEMARKILLKTCVAHPAIVGDPPASVTFQEFGDSSLNLVLRAFLRDYDSRMPTINDLHTRINEAFNEAGVVISFPQRDLHFRSVDPAAGSALKGNARPAAELDNTFSEATDSVKSET